jgi:hypothetical protein
MGYIEKFARFWRETDRTTGQTWLHEYTGPADFEDDAYAHEASRVADQFEQFFITAAPCGIVEYQEEAQHA